MEKPWGRYDLSSHFPNKVDKKIGEVWFTSQRHSHLPLLIKYIFTSEKLSIQVHPTDEQAKARDLSGGKCECWYVISAEPGAVIGLGLRQRITSEQLKVTAQDGSLEGLIHWRPVKPGSFFYVPAGAIHAIGAGVCLIEIQESNDVTFRLYDYGRPRALHLEDGVAVSRLIADDIVERDVSELLNGHLLDGKSSPFTLEKITLLGGEELRIDGSLSWLMSLDGSGALDSVPFQPGQCWLLERSSIVTATNTVTFLLARYIA